MGICVASADLNLSVWLGDGSGDGYQVYQEGCGLCNIPDISVDLIK